MTSQTPNPDRRLALVLWKGDVGGAEVLSVALADQMRSMGTAATIVFIENPEPLASRLSALELPYATVGLPRGRNIVRHMRRYASQVSEAGPDGALLVTCGYMGGALRAGGYRAPIIGVEHGDILYEEGPGPLRWAKRLAGAWADDVDVAVSDFILDYLQGHPHSPVTRRIYNGVDPSHFGSPTGPLPSDTIVVAFAGRLVFGKGVDYLLRAIATLPERALVLRIAGDGPERNRLESLARSLGIGRRVEFVGLEHDMARVWQTCDIAVVPSAEYIEACPMTPLEAMASSKPVIATYNGGLPEIVIDGETGILVPATDTVALAGALAIYAEDGDLRQRHGLAGREQVLTRFHINRCAREYLSLFDEIADGR